MSLHKKQNDLCDSNETDFSDLKAAFFNCTLKKAPATSHTRGLMDVSKAIMEKNDVEVDVIRAVDHNIAYGVYPDMKEHGWEKDEWPELFDTIINADILVLGSPIWLGEKSSVCTKVIERLYGQSGELNDKGQYLYYGKTGGCIITGNEDGVKHFTQRNTTFMTWNLMHTARLLKDNGGITAHGNQRTEWEAGCRFDHPNPEHR